MKDKKWDDLLSEFGDSSQLYDLGAAFFGSASSFLSELNPVQRAKVLSQAKRAKNYSRERRALFEKHFDQLAPHIKEGLQKGKLRLSDHTIYAIKQIKGKSVQIFEKSDEIITGFCNIKGAELPKNMAMLVCDLHIMAGVSLSDNKEDILASTFDSIRKYQALLSGEYNITVNGGSVTHGDDPLRSFLYQGTTEMPSVCLDLHNPFLIPDEKPITFEIKFGSMKGLEALTFLWVGMEGVCTIENKPDK